MASTSWIAGYDVEAVFGALLWDEDHILDTAVEVPGELEIPSARGAIFAGPHRTKVREFGLKYTLDGVSRAAVRANFEKMQALLGNGEDVSVRVADRTDLSIVARCVEFPAVIPGAHQVGIPMDIELLFRAPNPYWQSTTPSVVTFDATHTVMPQGTAASEPVLTSPVGVLAACTLKGYDYLDAEMWSATFEPLSGGEQYRITTQRFVMTIEKFTSGIWTNSDSSLTTGIFPRLLPSSGIGFQTSAWPRLSASVRTWTATFSRQWR